MSDDSSEKMRVLEREIEREERAQKKEDLQYRSAHLHLMIITEENQK